MIASPKFLAKRSPLRFSLFSLTAECSALRTRYSDYLLSHPEEAFPCGSIIEFPDSDR